MTATAISRNEWSNASTDQRRQWLAEGRLVRDEPTPGPWKVSDGNKRAVYSTVTQHRIDGNFTPIVCDCIRPTDGEGEANARLIAAAPCLLAACEEFISHYPCGINTFLDDAYRAARAAIAKARG